MIVVFTDDNTTEFGRAHMGCVPRVGEAIWLSLSTIGVANKPSIVRVKVEAVEYEAYNYDKVEDWMHPYTSAPDGKAILIVSPFDDEAKTYMDRVIAAQTLE